MHTTKLGGEWVNDLSTHISEQRDFVVVHNGDFSGDVMLVSQNAEQRESLEPTTFTIPMKFLREIVGQQLQQLEIQKLEKLGGAQYLARKMENYR